MLDDLLQVYPYPVWVILKSAMPCLACPLLWLRLARLLGGFMLYCTRSRRPAWQSDNFTRRDRGAFGALKSQSLNPLLTEGLSARLRMLADSSL